MRDWIEPVLVYLAMGVAAATGGVVGLVLATWLGLVWW